MAFSINVIKIKLGTNKISDTTAALGRTKLYPRKLKRIVGTVTKSG